MILIDMEFCYVRLNRFIIWMANGWSLPFVVEPMLEHHGYYSILMHRDVGDTA